MGLPQARLTDIGVGTCCCHSNPTCISMTGSIITSSPDVNANGLGIARLTDVVLGSCGHIGILVIASSNVYSNGIGSCRLTDYFDGCFFGTIVTGSPDVNTGG